MDRPRLLLIHGAWAGSWVWDPLLSGLAHAGFNPIAIDLPGNGSDALPPSQANMQVYIDRLVPWVTETPGPVGLIAHSGAGVIATQLAELLTEHVSLVVYIAGMMLPTGMAFSDLVETLLQEGQVEAAGIWPFLEWDSRKQVSQVPLAAARDIFFQDLPSVEAEAAARRLTPQGEQGRALTATFGPQGFGTLPRLYVETLRDRSVVLAAQRRMQALVPGAEVVSLDAGHAPQVSAPDRLLKALLPFLIAHGKTAASSESSSALNHESPDPRGSLND